MEVAIRNILLSWVASTYLRIVGWTSRIIWVNRSVREDLEALGRGYLYAFWHGRQSFLIYLHQHNRIRPLISRSGDGELVARICLAFGIRPVRGSSSRGGAAAVRRLAEAVKDGDRVAITPDGPRGPLRTVQPGVLYLAQESGAPIVPVAFGARRSWVFRSWDEYFIPKPFNRIAMVYGEPLHVGPNDNLEARAAELKDALDRVAAEADRVAGRVARG